MRFFVRIQTNIIERKIIEADDLEAARQKALDYGHICDPTGAVVEEHADTVLLSIQPIGEKDAKVK